MIPQNHGGDIYDALERLAELEDAMEMQNRFYLGLDLGQSADFSALAIIERQKRESMSFEPVFHCRHLHRWPLRTSYPTIVADTVRMLGSGHVQKGMIEPTLAVDATGVGAPVVDLFKRERMRADLMPIQITGGDSVTRDHGMTRVPKRDLVSTAQVYLQSGRLKIAPELPDAPTLVRELENFQVKISLDTAHDSYGVWREGSHDDLVLAVCLALWVGVESASRTPTHQPNYLR
jgi:hypothetical protein